MVNVKWMAKVTSSVTLTEGSHRALKLKDWLAARRHMALE